MPYVLGLRISVVRLNFQTVRIEMAGLFVLFSLSKVNFIINK